MNALIAMALVLGSIGLLLGLYLIVWALLESVWRALFGSFHNRVVAPDEPGVTVNAKRVIP